MANQSLPRRSLFSRLFERGAAAPSNESLDRLPIVTPSDQKAIALFVLLALLFMATSWLASGGLSGGLVEIDASEPQEARFQTDINSADWTELMQLPEIGEALAKRIVESRERNGPFTSPDDLDRVPGIGPKTLAKIRPFLRPID